MFAPISDLLTTDSTVLLLAGSTALGLAVALACWAVLDLMSAPRQAKEQLGIFEHQRRERLRAGSLLYRTFEPHIDIFAGWFSHGPPEALLKDKRHLTLSGNLLPWKPEEFRAARQIEGALVGMTAFLIGVALTTDLVMGLAAGLACGLFYAPLVRKQTQQRAEGHLKTIRRRLPFVMDLMALTMEAGASFLESLGIAAKENQNHPLGQQLGEVLRDISVGRTRREALEALQQRLGDDDVTEIVFAIIKGEELGTPLSQILRNQADQMRLKRSQWAERAAAEAQVSIVFPGLIVMIACLIIVVAPFVLSAYYTKR